MISCYYIFVKNKDSSKNRKGKVMAVLTVQKKKLMEIREWFVNKFFKKESIYYNSNNRVIIFETESIDYPYMCVSLTPLSKQAGENVINDLIEEEAAYNNYRMKRFIAKLMEKEKN